jgi:hypothetical protein
MTDHLTPSHTTTGRKSMPVLGGVRGGAVHVWESRITSEPCVAVCVAADVGDELVSAATDLTATQTWKLIEQLGYLLERHHQGDARPEAHRKVGSVEDLRWLVGRLAAAAPAETMLPPRLAVVVAECLAEHDPSRFTVAAPLGPLQRKAHTAPAWAEDYADSAERILRDRVAGAAFHLVAARNPAADAMAERSTLVETTTDDDHRTGTRRFELKETHPDE